MALSRCREVRGQSSKFRVQGSTLGGNSATFELGTWNLELFCRNAAARRHRRQPARSPLDAGHAEPRRRLGCLRQGQRQRVSLPRAVRRSQRHDRSEHARPHRPRAGSPGTAGAHSPTSHTFSGPSPSFAAPKSATAVGSAAGASTISTAPGKSSSGWRQSAFPPTIHSIRRGANWLLSCQQACGGWGESADSYEHPELRGQGPCTASQTAWALLGLMAAGASAQPLRRSAPRHPLPPRHAKPRRHVGRARVHGHRLPARLLPPLPLLPHLLPAAGA